MAKRKHPSSDTERSDEESQEGPTTGLYAYSLVEQTVAMASVFARLALAHNAAPTVIQRTAINKLIRNPTNRGVKFGAVFQATNEILADFGMRVEALPPRARAAAKAVPKTAPPPEGSGDTAYITVSTLGRDTKAILYGLDRVNYTLDISLEPSLKSVGAATDAEVISMGILMTMLVVIISSNNTIMERDFFRHMEAFGLVDRESPIQPPYLTLSLRGLLKVFVRQEYLAVHTENKDGADMLVEYSVGRRAQVELGALEILGFFKVLFHGQSDEDHMRMFVSALKGIYKDMETPSTTTIEPALGEPEAEEPPSSR